MILTLEDILTYQKTDLQNLFFLQIGTNDGNDFFNKLCQKYLPKNILLIEPHANLNESIKQNYKNLNYNIINIAITDDENIKNINMYSSTGRSEHSSIKPLKDWNTEQVFATVPTKTIKNVLKEFNIEHINLLYIDTEGFDSFIINSIFKSNLQNSFDIIVFEHWGFSPNDYDSPNELHGLEGLKNIEKLAETNNFIFADFQADGDKPNDNHVIYKKI
jgi:FkbM family methyltransferase